MSNVITPEMIESAAKVCHDANRAWCELQKDYSQPSWELAPEWQKESARKGVLFHFTHPDSKPEDSHNEWLKVKEAEGWTYGDVKDPDTKKHPCMVPFEKLPEMQKMKDHIFHGICHGMARGYGIR
jgi:hypothetical protein